MIEYAPTDAICLIIKNMTPYEVACLYISANKNKPFQNRIRLAIERSRVDILQVYEFIYNFQIEEEIEYDEEFDDDEPVIWPEEPVDNYEEPDHFVDYYYTDFINF